MVINTIEDLVFILKKANSLYLSSEQSSSAMKRAQYASRRNKKSKLIQSSNSSMSCYTLSGINSGRAFRTQDHTVIGAVQKLQFGYGRRRWPEGAERTYCSNQSPKSCFHCPVKHNRTLYGRSGHRNSLALLRFMLQQP